MVGFGSTGAIKCHLWGPIATLSISVDNQATVKIRGTEITITGDTSGAGEGGLLSANFSNHSLGIPPSSTSTYALYNVSGRGTVSITQQPGSGIPLTLQISDPQGSYSTYTFDIDYTSY